MKPQLITLKDLLDAANDEDFDHESVQILVYTPDEEGGEEPAEIEESPIEPEEGGDDEPLESEPAEPEGGDDELSEEKIKKMTKSELIALVDQYELELDIKSFKKVGELREAILKLYLEGGEEGGDDEPLEPEEDPVTVFEKGDPVRFKNGSKYEEGEILSVNDEEEKAEVKVGKKKYKVPVAKLELLEKE